MASKKFQRAVMIYLLHRVQEERRSRRLPTGPRSNKESRLYTLLLTAAGHTERSRSIQEFIFQRTTEKDSFLSLLCLFSLSVRQLEVLFVLLASKTNNQALKDTITLCIAIHYSHTKRKYYLQSLRPFLQKEKLFPT